MKNNWKTPKIKLKGCDKKEEDLFLFSFLLLHAYYWADFKDFGGSLLYTRMENEKNWWEGRGKENGRDFDPFLIFKTKWFFYPIERRAENKKNWKRRSVNLKGWK